MTQKDKQLLLADLSARLPYGVKIRIIHHEIKGADPEYVDDVFSTTHYNMIDYDDDNYEFLPYLRPMSSMTEEEREEYSSFVLRENDGYLTDGLPDYTGKHYVYIDNVNVFINWLLKNHFDYRGLIEKGLAIEVTEENNVYKEELDNG